jgi:tetratricopeptide (TPR) repeat protein
VALVLISAAAWLVALQLSGGSSAVEIGRGGEMERMIEVDIELHSFGEDRSTIDPEAREAFLVGRFHLDRIRQNPGQTDLDRRARAIESLRRATALAPEHEPSWSSLAEALLHGFEIAPGEAVEALNASRRAVSLDPESVDARLHRALASVEVGWQWCEAEADLRRALELAPGDLRVRGHLALQLSARGLHDQAVEQIETLLVLDPVNGALVGDAVAVYLGARRWPDVLAMADRLEKLDLYATWRQVARVLAHQQMGRDDLALAAAGEHLRLLGIDDAGLGNLGPEAGLEEYRRRKIGWLDREHPEEPISHALVRAALGHRQEALDAFERAIDRYPRMALFYAHDPRLDGIRQDRRFTRLVDRLGLGEETRIACADVRAHETGAGGARVSLASSSLPVGGY